MCWKTTSHRRRLGFCGDFATVSVFAPTAYERVQNRQYTGQIEVAVKVSLMINEKDALRAKGTTLTGETHQGTELFRGSGGLSQVQLFEISNCFSNQHVEIVRESSCSLSESRVNFW
jgi:hypothetical protein